MKVSAAFVWLEVIEEFAGTLPRGVNGSFSGFSHQMLELGEYLFDRVQVWAVRWQKHEPGPRGADRGSHCRLFMAAEV